MGVMYDNLIWFRDAYENTVNDNISLRGEIFQIRQSHLEIRNFISASLTYLMSNATAGNGEEE